MCFPFLVSKRHFLELVRFTFSHFIPVLLSLFIVACESADNSSDPLPSPSDASVPDVDRALNDITLSGSSVANGIEGDEITLSVTANDSSNVDHYEW